MTVLSADRVQHGPYRTRFWPPLGLGGHSRRRLTDAKPTSDLFGPARPAVEGCANCFTIAPAWVWDEGFVAPCRGRVRAITGGRT